MKKIFLICLTTFMLGLSSCGKEPVSSDEQAKEKFSVSFAVNEASYGSVSETLLENVLKGTAVTVADNKVTIGEREVSATPTTENAQYTYAFEGWEGTAATVESNMTITAKFIRTEKTFTVTWKNGALNHEIDEDCAYGTLLTDLVPTTNPTRESDKYFIYGEFQGWDINDDGIADELTDVKVVSDMTIEAVFEKTENAFGYMREIVTGATNGTIVFDDANGKVYGTPSSSGFSIKLDNEAIQALGEGKDFLALKLSGSPTEFQIIIDNSGEWKWGYVYTTLKTGQYFYIPLAGGESSRNVMYDPSICTNIILYSVNAGQKVDIDSLSFCDMDEIDYVTNVKNGVREDNVFTNTADNMYVSLNKDLMSTLGKDKEYVRIVVEGASSAFFTVICMPEGGSEVWNYNNIMGAIYANTPRQIYIPLHDKTVHDFSKNDLRLFSQYNTHGFKLLSIDFVNSEDFTFVNYVKNGSYDPVTKVATATASNMNVYLSREEINIAKGDNEFLAINLTGPADFRIKTKDSAGVENVDYIHETLKTKTYYVPLNNKSVHDFSKYDLPISSWESVHTITINSISFVKADQVEFVLSVDKGELVDGVYVPSAAGMTLRLNNSAVKACGAGKEFMVLELTGSPTEFMVILDNNGAWDWGYIYAAIYTKTKFYIPMAGDGRYDPARDQILLYSANAGQTIKIDSITFVDGDEIDLVASVTGGTRDGNTFTGTSDTGMYVRFDNSKIKLVCGDNNYMAITIEAINQTNYGLVTYDSSKAEKWSTTYNGKINAGTHVTIYVPLKDASIHDLSGKNGFAIYSATKDDGFTIISIEYVAEIPA